MGRITVVGILLTIFSCNTAIADTPRIEVSAEAKTSVRPNQAVLRVSVTAVARGTEQALAELKKRVDAVSDVLGKYKLKDEQVRKSEIEVNANVSHIAKKVVKEGYYAKLQLSFTLLELKHHEELSAKLAEVEGVEFGKPVYGRTDAKKIQRQTLKKALDNARDKGNFMAEVLGVKLGSPVYAGETVSYYRAEYQFSQGSYNNNDPFSGRTVPPAPQRVNHLDDVVFVSKVTVHYGIKE